MTNISGPGDGPVAVTGASGYIGSHVLKNLVEAGYTVRACVRDTSRDDKVSYLKDIGAKGPGSVELYACDLYKAAEGDYDQAFRGCSAVFHVAADFRSDPSNGRPDPRESVPYLYRGWDASSGHPDPQRIYDGCVTTTQSLLDSVARVGTVKRVVYTSSCAAIFGPGEGGAPADGYEFSEADWSGMGPFETLDSRWTFTSSRTGKVHKMWNVEHRAYAKGKVDAEKYGSAWGEEHGIDFVACNPCHVLGPLLGASQNQGWQNRIGVMLRGEGGHEGRFNEMWNIVDVRDVAESQRLMAERPEARNGSRYMLVATDESGELTVQQLIDTLREIYPDHGVGGDYVPPETPDLHHARCTKAIRELGLSTHAVRDTLKATGDSLIALGLVAPAAS